MILPTKGITPDRALLTVGARVLSLLDVPKTVSRLWDETRCSSSAHQEMTFDWFVLALDLLFIMDAVDVERGRLRRRSAKEVAA